MCSEFERFVYDLPKILVTYYQQCMWVLVCVWCFYSCVCVVWVGVGVATPTPTNTTHTHTHPPTCGLQSMCVCVCGLPSMCVCVHVRACVHACMHAWVGVCNGFMNLCTGVCIHLIN